MKKVFLTLIVLLPLCLLGQQTGETRIPVEQLEDLGDNNIIIGSPTLNNIIAFIASNMAVTPGSGLVATNVQDALDELQAEIAASGDGWGGDVVNSDVSLTGDGTAGSPLSVVQANINSSAINNDAGFITSPNDADADPTNEAQTLSKTGQTVTLTTAGGAGGGSFTDEVNDADADPVNEAQTATLTGNTVTLTDVSGSGGGTFTIAEDITTEVFTIAVTQSSVTLTGTPVSGKYIEVKRNGIDQTFATSGTATDVTLAGQTLTFNYRDLVAGDIVSVKFVD